MFKNKVSTEVVSIEKAEPGKFEKVRDLVSGARGRQVFVNGDPDYGIWYFFFFFFFFWYWLKKPNGS